ncbi:MAG: glycosyltransferase family 4 protein [Actinomycetota bacterium]
MLPADPGPRLRVLHVVGRMPPHGAQRQLVGMLRAAHLRHWDATLCVLRGRYDLTREIAAAGVPVIEHEDTGRFDPRRALRLRRLIQSGDFDVIHSSLWGCNAFTRLAALSPRRPAIVVSELSVENWRPRHRRLLDRTLRPLTDQYVGNSEAVRAFICTTHGVDRDRVTVIRNGLDREVFKPGAPRPPRAGPAVIGCMGRLVRDKGFQIAIRSLRSILAHRDVRLLVAGEGEYRRELESAAKGLPVELLGLLTTPEEVAGFLRGLDLFIMPSRYEGLPNAVLEALGCGLTVVATAVPGMAEASFGYAILVPPDDPEALASAVVRALDRPIRPPADLGIPSFDEVAALHLRTFRAGYARRNHGIKDSATVEQ